MAITSASTLGSKPASIWAARASRTFLASDAACWVNYAAAAPGVRPDRPRGIVKPCGERVDLDAMTARARGRQGTRLTPRAALGCDLRCGSPPVAARRRSAPPHPQAGGSAGNAPRWPRRASWGGPSSTRRASCYRAKITVKGARCAHVATATRHPLSVIFLGKTSAPTRRTGEPELLRAFRSSSGQLHGGG